ncbi:MAG: putative nickel-responsive regulator [Lentisphaerae bacterium ADurb.BinA184]|nr:MAG: putative nickel-responsive regulator [Lentisphaerae bacterium ADurb.BinA184]
MSQLVRTSIALEKPLADRLARLVRESGCTNRSEYLRDLLREKLVELEWERDATVVGTLTLVYDHARRRLSERLTDLQHHHHKAILATTHVHLGAHVCVEVIIVRGAAGAVKRIADELRRQKGVLHAALSLSTTGKALE